MLRTTLFAVVIMGAVACGSSSGGAANAGDPSGAGASDGEESGSAIAVQREVGACDASLAPLDVGPSSTPEVSVKGNTDGLSFLVKAGGVDCDGAEIDARDEGAGQIRVTLRFKRVNGEVESTFCRCSPDVKGSLTGLRPGAYEVQIRRERQENGEITEEVLTPTPVRVNVGPA